MQFSETFVIFCEYLELSPNWVKYKGREIEDRNKKKEKVKKNER